MDASPFLEPDNNIVAPGMETRIGGASTLYKLGARAVWLLISK